MPDRFRPVVRLRVDETVSRRHRRFATHLVDLDTGAVIATVQGRSAAALLHALAAQGPEWLAQVEQVAIDPFTPYAKAIRHLLPHARLIVDKLHVQGNPPGRRWRRAEPKHRHSRRLERHMPSR